MYTEKQIFSASCGKDLDGITKAIVKVEEDLININDKDPIEISSLIFDNPTIEIFSSRALTMIDLVFNSPDDNELIELNELLKEASKNCLKMDEMYEDVPSITVTICPKELGGKYYIVGFHSVWTLTSSTVNSLPDTMRFIVPNEYIHTYKVDIDSNELMEVLEEYE